MQAEELSEHNEEGGGLHLQERQESILQASEPRWPASSHETTRTLGNPHRSTTYHTQKLTKG